ncbi:TetR/AcrR family transcriptional regulator [Pedobacter miscanthi]|jgi:AcrR family transcriptional regulator|uniref:TetR/AcrR family transcriptional regulator n=1 Tax=Pedobacter miscanthi TaxID=2259170 RepID=UPI00292E4529|nr:TetR/AcrR family transcriptional regulator [Pedobacter miscanthi]
MGSKERIERLKEENSKLILDVSMDILKSEGWEAVSIKKIADIMEYSSPAIYSYFPSKEAILIALSQKGFMMLNNFIKQELDVTATSRERMEKFLFAYIQFALKENELYHLMYSTGKNAEDVGKSFPGLATFINLFRKEMEGLLNDAELSEETFRVNYLISISFAHGFVALNSYFKDIDPATNSLVLNKAIKEIIATMTVHS